MKRRLTFERRTDSNAVQMCNPVRSYAFFMIRRRRRRVAELGGWAESTEVEGPRFSLWRLRTILYATLRTFRCYLGNPSIKCDAASLILELQRQWATWRASFWARYSKVRWRHACIGSRRRWT
jgi:hypothetical protein